MKYPVAIFGPSFVGKSSFISTLIKGGQFSRAPLLTTRPPRSSGGEPEVRSVSEANLAHETQRGEWVINRIGSHQYATNIAAAKIRLRDKHVIIDAAPSTVTVFSKCFPSLATLLIWPENAATFSRSHSTTSQRSEVELRERTVLNSMLLQERPPSEFIFLIPWLSSAEEIERFYLELSSRLYAALEHR